MPRSPGHLLWRRRSLRGQSLLHSMRRCRRPLPLVACCAVGLGVSEVSRVAFACEEVQRPSVASPCFGSNARMLCCGASFRGTMQPAAQSRRTVSASPTRLPTAQARTGPLRSRCAILSGHRPPSHPVRLARTSRYFWRSAQRWQLSAAQRDLVELRGFRVVYVVSSSAVKRGSSAGAASWWVELGQ